MTGREVPWAQAEEMATLHLETNQTLKFRFLYWAAQVTGREVSWAEGKEMDPHLEMNQT